MTESGNISPNEATHASNQSNQAVTSPDGGESNPIFPAQKKRKKKSYFLIIGAIILVGFILGLIWYLHSLTHEDTDDSYVDGHITTVSSRVAGTVTAVFITDNQKVSVGMPLVKLDPRDFQVSVDQNRAAYEESQKKADANKKKVGQSRLTGQGQLTQASAAQESAMATIDKAKEALIGAKDAERKSRSKVNEQKAQLDYAKTDFERYRLTFAEDAVTKQQYDKAKENISVAEAQLQEAIHDLHQDQQKILQADSDVRDAEAQLLKAIGQKTSAVASDQQMGIDKSQYQGQVNSASMSKAQLEESLLQLSYCDIKAPVAGRVGRKNVEVGQRVQVGQSLMAIVQDDVWVTANFKETQLPKMKVGQKVEIKIDSFPGKVFIGKVDSFSPASGAKFSVLPPDNATGNFTKVVQRVPVKIVFDRKSIEKYEARIAPGMSCVTNVLF